MKSWAESEDVLWTLRKGDRTAEARSALAGAPELRIYTSNGPKAKFDLMWSQVAKTGRDVRTLAVEKKKEFEASGWA